MNFGLIRLALCCKLKCLIVNSVLALIGIIFPPGLVKLKFPIGWDGFGERGIKY